MAKEKIIKLQTNDLGLGTHSTVNQQRMVNPDGSFNLERRGVPFWQASALYHKLISMSWTRFILLVVAFYFVANLIFAAIYVLVGLDKLAGMIETSPTGKFWEAFFFSTQTFATVGYGRINPLGFGASFVSSVESLAGLLTFALATGLLYGRFSKPNAKIKYSKNALISPYMGIKGFMFRIANKRDNQLIEIEAQVSMSRNEMVDGVLKRQFYGLTLERSKINFFPTSWTIVHPIDENSPFYGRDHKQMISEETEVLILLKAFDDTFAQTVHSRSSYMAAEIIWGAKFASIYGTNEEGVTTFDLHRLSHYDLVSLPGEQIESIRVAEQEMA